MKQSLITLTTDFGASSPYVAQMKGVILSLNPLANIVDITHTIPPQDVRQGARVLDEVTGVFPAGTIHVAVVDPGVGSQRRIVYCRVGPQHYVAPDNGMLSLVTERTPAAQTIAITNRRYWRDPISATFHGRDILAPVAAYLSLGVAPQEFGDPLDQLMRLSWPEVSVAAHEIKGSVVSFDSFGNLITDVTGVLLAAARSSPSLKIRCGSFELNRIDRTYSAAAPHSLIALIGSSGLLELALVNGNAAHLLGVEVGDEVTITW